MQQFLEPQHADAQILRGYQRVIVKEGNLDAAPTDIHNGSPFPDQGMKNFPSESDGLIVQEALFGIAQNFHPDAGALADLIQHNARILGLPNGTGAIGGNLSPYRNPSHGQTPTAPGTVRPSCHG